MGRNKRKYQIGTTHGTEHRKEIVSHCQLIIYARKVLTWHTLLVGLFESNILVRYFRVSGVRLFIYEIYYYAHFH